MSAQAKSHKGGLFEGADLGSVLKNTFLRLNPIYQLRNPVMFLVFVGSVVTTVIFAVMLVDPKALIGGVCSSYPQNARPVLTLNGSSGLPATPATLRSSSRSPVGASPSGQTKMLSGLRSRCTTPARCA